MTVVHRRETFRAEKMLQAKLLAHPKVDVRWNAVVEDILGKDNPKSVTHARLRNVVTGKTEDLETDGIFVAIGHDPATALFKGQLAMDEGGYIITAPDSTSTSVAGVFAAGDVKDKIFRQAVTAAGMGLHGGARSR